ncbi:hypothetical protein F5146DRAFT_880937, partial [Armillaria mellea]
KPCEYFNLISGISTGELTTIMLGRLNMSTKEAFQSYNKIFGTMFCVENRKPFYRDSKFKATTLEKEIQDII